MVIAYRTCPFLSRYFLVYTFFRYMQHSSRKSQAWSANTIFECSIRSQAWLAMISSQSLWAPPKPQIWWGVGWGFPYWHLDLDELLLAPGFLCSWYLSGRGQEQSGEMEEMVTPFSCHTASNFWLYRRAIAAPSLLPKPLRCHWVLRQLAAMAILKTSLIFALYSAVTAAKTHWRIWLWNPSGPHQIIPSSMQSSPQLFSAFSSLSKSSATGRVGTFLD